jgi:hypothetical protein
MGDAVVVRGFARFRDLPRDQERLVDRNRSARDVLRQILAFDQLRHQRGHTAGLFEPMDVRDVRMIP